MVYMIAGSSHTGKTVLAQQLLEKTGFPYFSIDHLKMGLIRTGMTALSVEEDEKLTEFLWPIVREMIKTAIENHQNLIVEGCYIPFDWQSDFSEDYLRQIRACWLIMTPDYLLKHADAITNHACDIESRLENDVDMDDLMQDNLQMLEGCRKYGCHYILIDLDYPKNLTEQIVSLSAAAHLSV